MRKVRIAALVAVIATLALVMQSFPVSYAQTADVCTPANLNAPTPVGTPTPFGTPTPVPGPLVVSAATGTPKHALVLFLDGGHPELYTPQNAPNINALAKIGTSYTQAQASFPSDSMPNIIGAFTGATFAAQGIIYDYFYDRKMGQHVQIDEVQAPAGLKPTDLIRVPTLFQAAKAKGLRTAFISKHPAYCILNGPTAGGRGIDDFQAPEIATWQGSQSTYDQMTFDILRSQIKSANPPDIMGLYILAPSGAEKKLGQGITSTQTLKTIKLEDDEIGQTVTALKDAGMYNDTVIIITADHGNTPTPTNIKESAIKDFLAANNMPLLQDSHDDLYQVYLKDSSQAQAAMDLLSKPENKAKFGVDHFLTQADLKNMDANPADRTPDFIVIPTEGVVYSDSPKAAEHGGISQADLNIPLIISGPGIKQGVTLDDKVKIQQIAPTLAQLLGLNMPSATFPALTGAMSSSPTAGATPTAMAAGETPTAAMAMTSTATMAGETPTAAIAQPTAIMQPTAMVQPTAMMQPTATSGGNTPNLPHTGNGSNFIWLLLVALLALAGGFAARRANKVAR